LKDTWDLAARGIRARGLFRLVFRAAGETETMQQNIQDWFELGEGDPGFQLLTEGEITAVIFFLFIFTNTTCIIKFFIYLFSNFFLSFRAIFPFINPNDVSPLILISKCLL
jgi:hypothetical protein